MVGGKDGARFASRRVDPKREPINSRPFLSGASHREPRPRLRYIAIEQRRRLTARACKTEAGNKAQFGNERGPYVTELMSYRRKVGELENKLLQVSAP